MGLRENRDIKWKSQGKRFYEAREKEIGQIGNRLYEDVHLQFVLDCYHKGGFSNDPNKIWLDMQSTFAGLNSLVLLDYRNIEKIINEINVRISPNELGLKFPKGLIRVKNLTDLYRFSNILRTINHELTPDEAKVIQKAIVKYYNTPSLRQLYEKLVVQYNCLLDIYEDDIRKSLMKNWDDEKGFYRMVHGKKKCTSDTILNALTISQMASVELPEHINDDIVNRIEGFMAQDGYRTDVRKKHHPNLWSLFDLVISRYLTHQREPDERISSILEYIHACQSVHGGFLSGRHGKWPTILRTSAALFVIILLTDRAINCYPDCLTGGVIPSNI